MIDYARLVRKCKTVNEMNRLHIRLEDRLTLSEIHALEGQLSGGGDSAQLRIRRLLQTLARRLKFPRTFYRLITSKFVDKEARRAAEGGVLLRKRPGSSFPQESFMWFERINDWAGRTRKNGVEQFSRYRLMPNIMAYRGTGADGEKTLLICMTGKSFRMMVPISIFLQNLDAARFDVMVFRDPQRNAYRNGLRGLGNSLQTMIGNVEALLNRHRYRRIVSLGVSAGGVPALLMSLLLRLDKGISIAGNSPFDPRWRENGGDLLATLSRLGAQPGFDPNLLVMYGADDERDSRSAAELVSCLPAQLLEVRSGSVGLSIGHNVLYPILAQSRLDSFLSRVIDPDIKGYLDSQTAIGAPYLV